MNARPSESPPPTPNAEAQSASADAKERRTSERVAVTWSVDCRTEETFLYASIRNISELGIFVSTVDPLPVGTVLTLCFSPPGAPEPFLLSGRVQWVNRVKPLAENLNPGMGVRFLDLTLEARERLVEAIHTIAYVRYDVS